MVEFNTLLELYGLAAIFALMLVKSAGVPIPIPADAVMLAASASAVEGRFVFWQAFVALLIALVVGGVIQFMLVRGPGRAVIYRYGRYLGLTPTRLNAAAERLKRSGVLGISIAILTPGVRSVAVPAAGLAKLPGSQFVPGLTLGSALFLALHFLLGYIGGTALSALGNTISTPVLLAVAALSLVVGLALWYVIRRRQHPQETPGQALAEAWGAWHEAACPVCLALGATRRLQLDHEHLPAKGTARGAL